ncbi:MAG: right-handed parallel beta-helix repeat-containing protein [Candidatus Thiodiazotropha sp.]
MFRDSKSFAIYLLMVGVVFCSNAHAVIQHAGQLSQDETWDNTDTHLVTGDVSIPPGITLSITPGTTVEFDALNDSGNLGSDTTRTELTDKVILTSNAATPAAGDWAGIRVLNGGELSLRHAEIRYASIGVDYRQSGAVSRAPVIEDNLFEQLSGNGIYLESQNGVQLDLSVARNTLNNIGGRGIHLYSLGANTLVQGAIADNAIAATGLNGIHVQTLSSARDDLTVNGNTIQSTGGGTTNTDDRAALRFQVSSSYSAGYSDYTVSGNEVSASASYGIYFNHYYSDVNLDLSDNQVHDNANYGIYVYAYRYRTLNTRLVRNSVHTNGAAGIYLRDGNSGRLAAFNATLMLNEVHHNTGSGISLYLGGDAEVVHNSVHDNTTYGVHLDLTRSSRVNFNNLYGNDTTDGIALYNNGAAAVDARYNWWGDAISAEIGGGNNPKNLAGIYDVYDDTAKGSVDYANWLGGLQSEPLPTAPLSWVKSPADGLVTKAASYRIEGSASSLEPIERVEVSTDNGTTWEVATGTTSWSYDWTVPPGDGSYQIGISIDTSLPTTSGALGGNESWSGTVDLTGDVIVPEGATLTILPGTIINMPHKHDGTMGGSDASLSELIVNGSIIAIGTEVQPIVFTSDASSKAKGDWSGIVSYGDLNFEHVVVEYGDYGITCISRTPASECTIKHSTIAHTAGAGITYDADGNSIHPVTISNNNITDNSGIGAYLNAYRDGTEIVADISDNNINNNGSYGVYLHSDNRGKITAAVDRNIIDTNGTYGISGYSTNNAVHDVTIDDNDILSITGGEGIYLYSSYGNGTNYVVSNNELFDNANGLKLESYYTSTITYDVRDNLIHDNVYNGIETYVTGSSAVMAPFFSGNVIYNNATGMYLNLTGSVTLANQQSYDNDIDIHNNSAQAIDATGTWWGVDTTNLLATGTHPRNLSNIFDSYDDGSKGSVDYADWLIAFEQPQTPTLVAVQSPTATNVQTLTGSKTADSGIVINGTLAVPIDALTSWSYDLPLAEGTNGVNLYAVNASGLHSGNVNSSIVLDTQSPQVFSTSPLNGAVLNSAVATIEIVLYEASTNLDATASIAAATVKDATDIDVPGSWSNDFNRLIFTPTTAMGPGTYTATVQPTDSPLGNSTSYSLSFAVDTSAPAQVTLDPVVTPTRTSPVTLSGGKETGTAVYINNTLVVPLDANTTWSYSQALNEGSNSYSITARDEANNSSAPVEVTIVLDTLAPVITGITPANGGFVTQRPSAVVIAIEETNSGLDSAAIIASTGVTRGSGASVAGSWNIDGSNQLIFTPATLLTEDTYTVSATLMDLAGNTTPLNTSFTYDATPPAIPSINPVTTPTNSNSQVISGGKEANASVWVNGIEAVPVDANTTWSYQVALQPGLNTVTVFSKDRANNQSGNRSVEITYDDIAPLPVNELTVNAADIGSVAKLDWAAYDESVHGDIAGYRVYYADALFTNVSSMSPATSLPAGQKTFDVTGLVKGQTYYFAVVAYDSNDNINYSVTPVAATATDVVPPEEITNLQVSVGADNIALSWTHSVNSNNDLTEYKIYFNDDAGTSVTATVNSHSVTGLSPATGYPVRVTAIDADGNESTGVGLTAVTLLPNPGGVAGTPFSNLVELSWSPSLPSEYVKQYAIYDATADFTSVAGLTPVLRVDASRSSAKVAGLTNDTTYYFAVTAINLSDGETKTVTTVSATPQADTDGPAITNLTFAGVPLNEGATLTTAGTLAVDLSDESGVSRVEFQLDGVTLATDINGSDGYTGYWNLPEATDGAHTLTVTAYDTLDNSSSLSRGVTVALAAPEAPTITAPADGTPTTLDSITVTGTAEADSEVLVQVGGSQVAGPLALDANDNFQTLVTLSEGANVITASAQNRGGTGPVSTAVTITLDTSVPDTPVGLNAQSQTEGQVLLTWNLSSDERVVSYDVYRSSQSFSDIGQAVKANSSPVTSNRFVDLPLAEGVFYYRVVALNDVDTPSLPSNESSAEADSLLPRAVLIDYTPYGNTDPDTGRMAAGQVDVSVEVSEPLLTTPFLSLTPPGGVPLTVNLSQTSETRYTGSFEITDTTPSGTTYAVFSARDRVGNRGNEIDQGATILIDTDGPAITQMTVAPSSPIKNDQATPVDVNLEFTLDQPVKSGTLPEMNYLLSGGGRQPAAISNLVQTDTLVWRGSFQLPADGGLTEAETLSFEFTAQDDLDTVSHAINAGNSYQVYQGDLPPLDIPTGLSATALPGGGVELQWQAVEDAVEYQLYRQAPGEAELTAYNRVSAASFTDTGLIDGDYTYSVASVRQANAQESVSGQSDPVTVSSDGLASQPPENLSLELVGAGIKALWDAPTGNTEELSYNLYRASGTTLTDVTGLTPIQTHIVADTNDVLGYIDTSPDENASVYAVTAVDAVGNESVPSVSAYLNVGLLPVASLQVTQTDGGYPEISWSHNSGAIAGYNLYLDDSTTPLNTSLMTITSYTDQAYTGTARRYTVTAVDTNSVESVGRTVELPLIDVSPVSEAGIKRGIMNRIGYVVANLTATPVTGVTLKVDVEGHAHSSSAFDLAAGESRTVEMIIGGFDTLPGNAALQTTAEITADTGEKAEIVENGQITVGEASLLAQVETQELTRGTNGQIRFSLENTSDVVTEIITAQGSNPSSEITLLLEDLDGNVLATAPFKQQVGTGVLTLSSGSTVARIEPGARFTSDWFALPIPESAPDQVRIRLQIDQLHYHLGQADHLAIAGTATSQDGVLSDTAYTASIDSITPASSYGDEPIMISGQALERGTAQLLAQVPVKLVIVANGFERQTEVTTDSSGNYQYQFDPLPAESGIFTVSAIHPDILARPGQGQFTINRVLVKPTTLRLSLPKNYEQSFNVIQATTGEGTTATNLRLVYDAADQPLQVFPTGITLTLGDALTLQPESSGKLPFTIIGDNSADLTGTLVLKVMSDESGADPLAIVNLEYALSDAEPALYFTPNFVETGVAHDASINETVTLENRGLADLTDITVSLLTDTDGPAPSWIYLMSPQDQGTLAIGATKQIQLTANPPATVSDGIYGFKLRVESSNYPTTDITRMC